MIRRIDVVLFAAAGVMTAIGALLPWEVVRTVDPPAPDVTHAGVASAWGRVALSLGLAVMVCAVLLLRRRARWMRPLLTAAFAAALYATVFGAYRHGIGDRIVPDSGIAFAEAALGLHMAEIAVALLVLATIAGCVMAARASGRAVNP